VARKIIVRRDGKMGDVWEALDRLPKSSTVASNGEQKLSKMSPTVLAEISKTYFRQADFSRSGRIDDEESIEVLEKVAVHGGFTLPTHGRITDMIARCSSQKPFLLLDEFVIFIQHIALGTEPPEAPLQATVPATPTPHPKAPAPAEATPLSTPTPLPASSVQQPPAPTPVLAAPAPVGHGYGLLRVRVIELSDLPARADGSARDPYAAVAVNELTRRRTRRTHTPRVNFPNVEWDEAFDFERASSGALVVVDLWDKLADGRSELLGKALISLDDCRLGVPHLVLSKLAFGGTLAVRVLLVGSDELLPSDA
jgi:hypothetical protein